MNKNTKGVVAVTVVIAVGAAAYFLFKNKKKAYARIIVDSGNASNMAVLMTFGEDYLKAWAKAVKKGESTFSLGGNSYSVKGGKRIVAASGNTPTGSNTNVKAPVIVPIAGIPTRMPWS